MLAETHPLIRQLIRFILLPYCFYKIDWKHCSRSPFFVLLDMLYIFFRLKTFPDHYSSCRLWCVDKKKWPLYYGSIYNPYQRARLRRLVQKGEYQPFIGNKLLVAKYCEALKIAQPNLVGFVEKKCQKKIFQLLREFNKDQLIIKPVNGRAGMGISLAKKHNNTVLIYTHTGSFSINEFVLKEDAIVQDVVIQSNEISAFAAASVNTIRIVTLLTKSGSVVIPSARIRFGNGTSFVDNVSAGGMAVGIDCKTGKLFDHAVDKNGNRFSKHPTSGLQFKEFTIPSWAAVVALAEKVQLGFSFYCLLGLDIAIDYNNEPVLIEVNANPDIIGEERTTGPYLEKDEVLKTFYEYDLLVCGAQRKLYRE